MWDRSYRWQRLARTASGAAMLVAAVVALGVWGRSSTASRLDSVGREFVQEMFPSEAARVEVVVPSDLAVQSGNLVYQQRADGETQVIGRVADWQPDGADRTRLEIVLAPTAVEAYRGGGLLQGAPPTVSVEQAIRLLVSPETPRDEAVRARDAIWPKIEETVLPQLMHNLMTELADAFSSPDERDKALFVETLDELRDEIAPLEEDLIGRLALRTWKVVGVKGVASGVLRSAKIDLGNTSKDVRDWFQGKLGGDGKDDRSSREFLPEQTREELRVALEDEVRAFWLEHRDEVVERIAGVLARRKGEFVALFQQRWAPLLYDRVVEPAWAAGEPAVIRAAESYASDFIQRRLVTERGGPRLLFAHALRSALEISDTPLLVLSPRDNNAGRFDYEPLVP